MARELLTILAGPERRPGARHRVAVDRELVAAAQDLHLELVLDLRIQPLPPQVLQHGGAVGADSEQFPEGRVGVAPELEPLDELRARSGLLDAWFWRAGSLAVIVYALWMSKRQTEGEKAAETALTGAEKK